MVVKKRQILWDWTNTAGTLNPGIPEKINQIPFAENGPVASVVNWNAWEPPEVNGRAPFRPMVRVLESTKGNDWATIQASKFPIILFFNEPERAGITPEQAKEIWYKQMLPLRKNKGKKLGSPAVASDENGQKWIERFMSLVSSDPPDFICLHYYSKKGNEAMKYIENMHNKWPKHKVMVTEIACIDRDYQAVLAFTVQVCNWMDKQDWIFEYGLFDFQRKVANDFVSPAAQLMDKNGNFTELGNMYVHQQPMTLAGKAFTTNALVEADAIGSDSTKVEIKEHNGETLAANGFPNTGTPGEPLLHDTSSRTFQVSETDGKVQAAMKMSETTALDPDGQNALNAHNSKRKEKGLQPLAWDTRLTRSASTYAQHLAKIGKMEHSPSDQRPNQGENLAWASASTTPLVMAANMWLAEEKNYHGESIGQGNFGSYGHYTQCMWKSTTKIGIASAKDNKGGIYIVGRYSPPGNLIGQKPY